MRCSRCKADKPLTDFGDINGRKRKRCLPCQDKDRGYRVAQGIPVERPIEKAENVAGPTYYAQYRWD